MALTLSEATTDVRNLLNEPTAVFWTDGEIEDWIKEGTRIIASKALCAEESGDLTLAASQLSYTSSDAAFIGDMLEPYAAIYDNGSSSYKGIQKIHPRHLGNVATFTAGDPRYYCFHNRTVYIWPLTTAAVVSAGGIITFLYAKETEDITDLTDEFQHLAIKYAFAKAKHKDMKFAEAASLLGEFYQELAFERSDKSERELDSERDMKSITTRG